MSKMIVITQKKIIFIAQIISLSLIWIFVITIALWILNLISLSVELDDAPGASIGISLIAIPVFFALASLLTYAFIGLKKDEFRLQKEAMEE